LLQKAKKLLGEDVDDEPVNEEPFEGFKLGSGKIAKITPQSIEVRCFICVVWLFSFYFQKAKKLLGEDVDDEPVKEQPFEGFKLGSGKIAKITPQSIEVRFMFGISNCILTLS
jgi:NRPS condensation-like uncharacterized protein